MKKLEIERRWLVKLPLSEEAQRMVETDPDVPTYIVQTYLKSDNDETHRVRLIEYDMWGTRQPAHYTTTSKRRVELGINEETENALTEIEYQAKLLERDPETIDLRKMRYHLHHKGRLFEFDVFEDQWMGLAILECEVPSLDTEVELPPHLEVDREITKEAGWSNADLAHRYSQPQGVWFGQTGVIDEEEREGFFREADWKYPTKPKTGWFERLMNWFRPEAPSYDGRNERVYGEQIDEEID